MIFADGVEDYLRSIIPAPDPVLAEMIAHGERDDVPIVYPETGLLLEVLVALTGARRAVEVGTAIGVSTLHIARALQDGGSVTSFEVDAARHEAARGYLDRAGLSDRVDLRLKDGAEGLAELEGPFDFAFIDALKGDYPRHLVAGGAAPAAGRRRRCRQCAALRRGGGGIAADPLVGRGCAHDAGVQCRSVS